MNHTWRENVRKVVPYVPGEQPCMDGMIKLNTNENPYPPAPGVRKRLHEIDPDAFRLYPNTQAAPIAEALALRHGRRMEELFVGVGSDDVLAMAFLTFFTGERPVLFPDVTYSFYDVWANLYGIPFRQIPVREDFGIRKEDYGMPNGGIVIANPNAPTGLYEPVSFIEYVVSSNPGSVVIVDEAYVDFAGESAASLIDQYDNLLVVQTFSKSRSMAGLRIGYAMGHPDLIASMNAVKFSYNSYTLNLPAQLLGAESVRDEVYFQEIVKKIVDTREWAKEQFRSLGFLFPDSKTNFLFVTHPEAGAELILHELRKNKIFVRHFTGERIRNYLRVTIGTDEQMEYLFRHMKQIVSKHGA